VKPHGRLTPGKPGRELVLQGISDDRGVLRIFVANDRFYVLLVWGNNVRTNTLEAAAFLQSLAFD